LTNASIRRALTGLAIVAALSADIAAATLASAQATTSRSGQPAAGKPAVIHSAPLLAQTGMAGRFQATPERVSQVAGGPATDPADDGSHDWNLRGARYQQAPPPEAVQHAGILR
jgi:hypothetical protein